MKFIKSLKKFLKNSDNLVTIVFVLGIIIVVNFLSYQIFTRWDLTESNVYSLSEVSEKVASKTDDVAHIKVYFSKGLPSRFIGLRQNVQDILSEYVNYSQGNIKVEFINPEEMKNGQEKLARKGIPPQRIDVVKEDSFQSVKAYLGMEISYGGNSEVIPVIENTGDLEYQVTKALKKVTSDEEYTIGIVNSNGTYQKNNELRSVYQELSKIYDIEEIDLSKNTAIPQNLRSLLIIGPSEEFSEEQLKAIDTYVMQGGSLLVLSNGTEVDIQNMQASVNNTGLNELLQDYGVKINKNLVLDKSCGQVEFSTGSFPFRVNYFLWPKIIKENFNQDKAMVAKLESLVLPWTSSLDILKDSLVTPLVKTSSNSWSQEQNFNLGPEQQPPSKSSLDQKVIAALISGKLESPYSDKNTDSSNVIVVGDSDFINQNFLNYSPANMIFFQNLVDSLSLDTDLINIRSQGVTDRPIKELSNSERSLIKYLNIFGVTVVVIVFGMVRYYVRRKRSYNNKIKW